jgi:hypothetical protein
MELTFRTATIASARAAVEVSWETTTLTCPDTVTLQVHAESLVELFETGVFRAVHPPPQVFTGDGAEVDVVVAAIVGVVPPMASPKTAIRNSPEDAQGVAPPTPRLTRVVVPRLAVEFTDHVRARQPVGSPPDCSPSM